MTNPSTVESRERLLLLTLAGIQFTHILDFMIMMPLGPVFVRTFGISTQQFGFLVSMYTFSAAIAGVLATSFIDRFERKRLLLTLYACFGVATFLCALAPGYHLMLIARALSGLFGGVLGAMVFTVIGDSVPDARRGRATGVVMAAFSISTVAGVPMGLLLSHALGWRAPFVFAALLCVVFWLIGWRALPVIDRHLLPEAAGDRSIHPLQPLLAVLRNANHLRAFVFVVLMMFGGFSVIPFITIYYTSNVGVAESALPLMYFFGGLCTFFTSRWFGRLADRLGKVRVYRWVAVASLLPLFTMTHLPAVPLWLALINSTVFFILVPGRMVPGMAMVTSAAQPAHRGAFMSLNASIMQLASGAASLIGGLIVYQNAAGQMLRYDWVGYIALAATLLALYVAGYVQVADPIAVPVKEAESVS